MESSIQGGRHAPWACYRSFRSHACCSFSRASLTGPVPVVHRLGDYARTSVTGRARRSCAGGEPLWELRTEL